MSSPSKVLTLTTLGSGSYDEQRILALLAPLSPEPFAFDRARKWRMFRTLFGRLRKERPSLVVMEGTGVAGGAALILSRWLFGQRYVVSSGDAVGPWLASRKRWMAPLFAFYERQLCRWSAGFIGWTPYLAGRAITFGAPRAMTAPGWAPFQDTVVDLAELARRSRAELSIPPHQLVVGIAGSLVWSRRYGYCYGLELVEAARRIKRDDVTFLIIGDGDGRRELERRAADLPQGRVVFTGRIAPADLPRYYATFDVASLPQSVDQVGSFRYTIKLSEYAHFRLPVVTGQIPLAYDLDDGWLWRLPGAAPWDRRYIDALARLIDSLDQPAIDAKRAAFGNLAQIFDREAQVRRVEQFLRDLLDDAGLAGR